MDNGFDPSYDDNKAEDVLYIGKECQNEDSDKKYRAMEILTSQNGSLLTTKNKENNSIAIDFNIIDRETLFLSPTGQFKIFCWLIEDNEKRGIRGLHISRRASKGVYGSQEITLNGKSVILLKNFLNNIHVINTSNRETFKLPISELEDRKYNTIINDEEFNEIIRANINSTDDFYKLLSIQKMELGINKLEDIIYGNYKNELEIQKFLRENIWMFGNDFTFIAENGKINAQNILDIMPKNIESYVDIIEVKLPNEQLFNFDQNHNNHYPTSDLTKAISQTQNYIFELEKRTNDEEYQIKNNCKIIKPKGIIIFGSKEQLKRSEMEYLRILNSSYHNLKILTYQQLLEKAKNTINYIKNI